MSSISRIIDQIQNMDGVTLALSVAAAGTVMAATSYLLSQPKPIKYLVDMKKQSAVLEGGERASTLTPADTFYENYYEDVKTLYDSFKHGVKISSNHKCLGMLNDDQSDYIWKTYQQVYDMAHQFGSALLETGYMASHPNQNPQPGNFLGIYSLNRPEWVVAEQGCNMFSLVVVALYDTLGTEACCHIMNQTEMRVVVCDNGKKVDCLLDTTDKSPSLKLIIVMDMTSVSDQQVQKAHQFGIEIKSFQNMLDLGKKKKREPDPPSSEEVATLCYTSGTTGNPKGVMLTHGNIVNNCSAITLLMVNTEAFVINSTTDTHLSYLPLAHQFERCVVTYLLLHGIKVGFFSGNIKNLTKEMQLLQPTIFPTVPRLLNKVYDKVMEGVRGSKIKSYLLHLAIKRKQKEVERGIIRKNSIWDKLVFRKIQNGLGGRVRCVLTGSAPLASNVMSFFRCAFGCPVFEGYGQTECTAAATLTSFGDSESGHVGVPVVNNRIKLIDVPDMEYYAKEGKGEICIKGSNVMIGYYKEPEKTAEAIDADGWLHTGDIGAWTENETLKIIDRKKHMFKLAQGEYIAPEKIENIYVRSPLVAMMFVDGNSLEAFAVGIAVPDPDVLPAWAKENGFKGSIPELCKNEKLNEIILKDITDQGKKAGLKSFEQVKCIHLHPELFSIENELLTPTFKNKRPAMRKYFQNIINNLYETHRV